MGDILFRESKFNEAERAYSTAVQVDPHCARGYWGLGRLEILTSHREAAHDHIAKAFQLNPREPDIVLSFADFVQDPSARITLLRNFLALANGNSEDRARRGDVAARLEITERLGHVDLARLASPYRPYRIKLAGYFPNGHTQSGLLIQVSLNGGRRLQLILDSGADGIFVNAASARAAKVEPLIAERVDDVGSAADSNAYVALAHHVTMGSLELEDCLVHVTDTSAFPTADGV
ncbi:MAG TPA: aspartyl protease family protein, partial [Bryobacteraceae bacterium]|nr:aspartyl protease family protein [Bryobacteraceae bacterium]